MKRTRQNKEPDAILTADWHLRENQPTCRTDNFWNVQWEKVDFIRELQMKYRCPIIHAGDLFHYWKPSPYLLSETIKHLPYDREYTTFFTVYGQHDLPQHSLELHNKSGIYTLEQAGKLETNGQYYFVRLEMCHWNTIPTNDYNEILVWHIMTYKNKLPWPGCTDSLATKLLRKYSQYDLIVTGDNHKSFVEEYEGRLLVNPGSLTRQTADQIDHRPCVYLWYAEMNTVQSVYLPIEQDVITREHIARQEQRDERIDAFISRLDNDWKAAVSFEENLERFAQTNKIRESVMEIVNKAVEL